MISVDRIENGIAVCETENGYLNIKIDEIKGRVKEGSILTFDGKIYAVDENATSNRRKIIADKQNSLFDN